MVIVSTLILFVVLFGGYSYIVLCTVWNEPCQQVSFDNDEFQKLNQT